jgi:antitoxin component YwqK of YwqJK toxin-antitoxin module
MKKLLSIGAFVLLFSMPTDAQKYLRPGNGTDEIELRSSISHSAIIVSGAYFYRKPPLINEFLPAKSRQNDQTITVYHQNGVKKLSAFARKNILHKKWQSWYASNDACDEGNFKKGVPDGTWRVWHRNGQLRYIRTYDAELLYKLKDEWIRRPRNSFYPITTLAKENIRKAAWYISTEHAFSLPPTQKTASVNELLSQNMEDSLRYVPPFSEGLLHGLYINYFSTGLVKDSGYYRYGIREGDWLECNSDGTIISRGFYRHGTRKGTWRYYQGKQLMQLKEFDNKGKNIYTRNFSIALSTTIGKKNRQVYF